LPLGGDLSALQSDARVSLAVWDAVSLMGQRDHQLERRDAPTEFALTRNDGLTPAVFRVLGAGDSIRDDEWTFIAYADADESVVMSAGYFARDLPYKRTLADTCKAAAELSARLDDVALLPGHLREEALLVLAQSVGMSVDDVLAHALWMDLGAHHI
jgi:hypothetical protein